MVLIKITSDNAESEIVTTEAYEAFVLAMSTGDYHTHSAQILIMPESDPRFKVALETSALIIDSLNEGYYL